MTRSELKKFVKKIDINTRNLVIGMESSKFRSRFKGEGIEFSDVREYAPGDDVRRIDWNVSARNKKLFVKEFVAERELSVYVIVDFSASTDFGLEKTKLDLEKEIALSLVYAAIKNNDKAGIGFFTDELELFRPALKGDKTLARIFQEVSDYIPRHKQTNIFESLKQINSKIRRRSTIFIISDFLSESFFDALKPLQLKHEIILVNISDLRESHIPEIGNVLLEDAETGEQVLVNTSDKQFRELYDSQLKEQKNEFSKKITKIGIDMIHVDHNEPFDVTFNRFFKTRFSKR